MKNRSRPVQILFCMNENEKAMLDEKVKNAGFTNIGAFIRKMLLSGYILKIDFEPINQLVSLTSHLSNNLNQLAKRANSYALNHSEVVLGEPRQELPMTFEDIEAIKKLIKELHDTNKLLLNKIGAL